MADAIAMALRAATGPLGVVKVGGSIYGCRTAAFAPHSFTLMVQPEAIGTEVIREGIEWAWDPALIDGGQA